ncbi:hypothetical protein WFZ85_10620 [Flavobacterium sp. j3]|uniref:Uncharacterized protein n=1 Tax=Flavobacterium aureirubrum TaxID=3133147 RepID=A0ABU9N5V6_9FLAO
MEFFFTTVKNENTRLFLWDEWTKLDNKYTLQIRGRALYVIEIENEKLRYIFMTFEALEGDKNIGYEKKLLKYKFVI